VATGDALKRGNLSAQCADFLTVATHRNTYRTANRRGFCRKTSR
jgi:hypothetical protein